MRFFDEKFRFSLCNFVICGKESVKLRSETWLPGDFPELVDWCLKLASGMEFRTGFQLDK